MSVADLRDTYLALRLAPDLKKGKSSILKIGQSFSNHFSDLSENFTR